MTKKIEVFENLAYMQAVRNDHLNPLIRRVEDEMVPTVSLLENEMQHTFKDVTLDVTNKILKFERSLGGGFEQVELEPIMPKFTGIGVQNQQGSGPSAGIKLVQFQDATVTVHPSGEDVTVGFDWPGIFDHNQKWPEAVIKGTVSHMKNILFLGDPDAAKVVGDGISLNIPKLEPMMVSIPDKGGSYINPRPVTAIEVAGEVGSTSIVGDKLTLTLNAGGGGGGTVTNQNFKGFFESLGDLISKVTDPLHGKSFAYVKDSTLGGSYYTAYFYVNNSWTELKQDPALTYNAPSATTNQGVFSIKPSEKITLDSTGQLNLDGLSTPQLPQYFVGFFNSLDELKVQVPNPVPYMTCAYVKGPAGGWLNYRAEKQGSASLWRVVAPLGSFSYVDEGAGSYTQVYGIKRSPGWTVDSQGLLTFAGGGGIGNGLNVAISDYNGTIETHDVKAMTFPRAKSMVTFEGAAKDEIVLQHPQRVIKYDSTFEANHNTQDYEGNIFYDENSRTWMGWSVPSAPGAVGAKWTRIAHEDMSLEVKDLVRRVPAKSASITPGLIGDNAMWDHNGVTFIEKDSTAIPDELNGICGGYVTTSVQDKDSAGITIPQFRIQTLTADREAGGTWVRRFIATGSGGAAVSWSKWVRTSFSRDDIIKHEKDPNAHKSVMKFYRIYAVQGKVWDLHNQEQYGVKGVIRDGNRSLLADTYGITDQDYDYGTVPYDGNFKGNGVIEFSGYNGTATALGKWTVKVRVLKKGATTPTDIYTGYYTHTKDQERFPPIKFSVPQREASIGDQVFIHVYFDNPTGLKNRQPDLYICPIKSYIVFQDAETVAGSQIANSFRNLLGRVDSFGDVGIRVHHNEYATNKNVRVYGVISNTPPVELNPT